MNDIMENGSSLSVPFHPILIFSVFPLGTISYEDTWLAFFSLLV